MTLADEGLKMAVDSNVLGSHNTIEGMNRLRGDLCPNTFMREYFEKNGMWNSTVDDMGFADAASECIQAGMDLRQHSFADRALLHHPLHIFA